MTSDRLFVYGTLMRGFDHPMARLLSGSADFLGGASCQGRLYLVKHYPGLVLSEDPADTVFGELFALRDFLGFSRNVIVHLYEAALRRHGLDYYLVGGRAFFAQQEIYDLLNLLRALENIG